MEPCVLELEGFNGRGEAESQGQGWLVLDPRVRAGSGGPVPSTDPVEPHTSWGRMSTCTHLAPPCSATAPALPPAGGEGAHRGERDL